MNDILPARLVLFDGICNLCNSAVRFIISHDKFDRMVFTSLQSDAGQKVLMTFHLPTIDFDTFVYISDGKVYDRSTAALTVLRDLGGFGKLMYIFILIPRPLRDWVYRFIARHRYRIFGKTDTCMVPTPELIKKFL
jgi:predicted DCC family thiol-disulfide oxidoreductase YuxK